MALELGATGESVRAVQEMLNFLGAHVPGEVVDAGWVPLPINGTYGKSTELAVMVFQQQHGILVDGKVGSITLKELEEEYRTTRLSLDSPGADSVEGHPGRLTFEASPADVYRQSYSRVWLRSDTAERYRAVYASVNAAGAKLTSSGGKRDLKAPVTTGRSATSFHYTGRALDLFLYSGMVNPKTDPYVIVRDGERLHRVFARCNDASGEALKLTQVVTYAQRRGTLTAEGRFIDLTDLFEKQGFRRINARPDFATGGSEIGAEWWHFQDETDLVVGQSTFGQELLKVYSEATVAATPPWQFRDRVFGKNWG
jgi:hypothetical protein